MSYIGLQNKAIFKCHTFTDSLYNNLMTDEGGNPFPNEDEDLSDLIEEFLDYVAYFGMPRGGGASLAFNTSLASLEREDLKAILEEFVEYAKDEPPDPDEMDDLLWGRVDPDDIE